MSVQTNMQKATIINLDTGVSIACQFNPGEYTFRKRNQWKETPNKGNDVPTFDFSGGKPATLKLKLFFDTTETGEDVRLKYTNDIWNIMKVNPDKVNPRTGKGEPPECRFMWGKVWHFTAVITNISQKFTMFLADGTPVRATLDVTFQQIKDDQKYPFQNPTSRSEYRKTRVVRQGDRIDLIAFEEFGDPNRWYELAKFNNISNPMELQAGQVLDIPLQL